MDGVDQVALATYAFMLVLYVVSVAGVLLSEYIGAKRWRVELQLKLEAARKKEPDPKMRETAYLFLNGLVHLGDSRLTEVHSQVNDLADTIYQHRMKLCTRAGLDFEDADMEAIVAAYEQMNRLCQEAMYDKGWLDAIAPPADLLDRHEAEHKT